MSLINKCLPKQTPQQPFAKPRLVPSQIDTGVEPSNVQMGQDHGEIPFTGEQPQAGDMGVISGTGSRKVVRTGQSTRQYTAPTFVQGCFCNCGTNSGIALYLTAVQQSGALLIVDNTSDTLLQFSGLGELGFGVGNIAFPNGGGIAVDPNPPNNLYILDDRRSLLTIKTDTNPLIKRGYFTIVTYKIVGGQYQASSYFNLTDPHIPSPSDVFPINPEPDPPAVPTNCVSVINGLLHITMLKSPARYFTFDGTTLTTHNILQNGANYNKGLRGPILTAASPAKSTDRFVIATDGTTYEVLQFNSSDVFEKNFDLSGVPASNANGLVTMCNRMIVLNVVIPTS